MCRDCGRGRNSASSAISLGWPMRRAPLLASFYAACGHIASTLTCPCSRSQYQKKRGGHVKPAAFAYTRARTLKEAVTLLARHKDDARLLAGGQSLIATLNMRLSAPELLIDINGIKGLD